MHQFLFQFLGSHSTTDEDLSLLWFYSVLTGKQLLADTYNIKKLEFSVLFNLFYHKESCQEFLIISEPLHQRGSGRVTGTMNWLFYGLLRNCGSILWKGKGFRHSKNFRTDSGAQSASYLMNIRGSFTWGKAEINAPSYTVYFWIGWSRISNPHVYLRRRLGPLYHYFTVSLIFAKSRNHGT